MIAYPGMSPLRSRSLTVLLCVLVNAGPALSAEKSPRPLVRHRFDELTLSVPEGWIIAQQQEVLQGWPDRRSTPIPALMFYRVAYSQNVTPRQLAEGVLSSWKAQGTVEPVEEIPEKK